MTTTLIRGGTVVTAEGEFRSDVLCYGETVHSVGPDLEAPPGTLVIDAGGCDMRNRVNAREEQEHRHDAAHGEEEILDVLLLADHWNLL